MPRRFLPTPHCAYFRSTKLPRHATHAHRKEEAPHASMFPRYSSTASIFCPQSRSRRDTDLLVFPPAILIQITPFAGCTTPVAPYIDTCTHQMAMMANPLLLAFFVEQNSSIITHLPFDILAISRDQLIIDYRYNHFCSRTQQQIMASIRSK